VHLKNRDVKIPTGGHLQGIQRVWTNQFLITASSGSFSYYLSARIIHAGGKSEIMSIQKIADSPFRHAGGCQVYDLKLVAGVEDNEAKNKSDIMMITLNEFGNETARQVIAHREGTVKRSTAGAVGFTKIKSGQYLAAVGDWDSRNIDFYLSKTGNDTLFDSIGTFHAPDGEKWLSYQSLNLLTDTSGKVYLIGFGLDGTHNRADLFEVRADKEVPDLHLIGTSIFKCRGGAGFRFGSGICVYDNNRLLIYACSRSARLGTTVNIFDNRNLPYKYPSPNEHW
jgi:hypothetical protein